MFQGRSFQASAARMIFALLIPTPLIAQSSHGLGEPVGIAYERSGPDISKANPAVTIENSHELPDAPEPQSGPVSSNPHAAPPQSTGSISGTVQDTHGSAILGVRVTLTDNSKIAGRVVTVGSKGDFVFVGLPPGSYKLAIPLPGHPPSAETDIVLHAGQQLVLPIVTARTPKTSTTVHVEANLTQVAQAQVKIEEKQRVLGMVPNFYTSYIWDSAPMTPKLKFDLALRSTIDPAHLMVSAGVAGIEQWHNTFPGYGSGWDGYGKRFGSAYTDSVISTFVGRAILPTVLHQDPRYFYRGTGSIRSRALYAIKATFITRGDDGRTEPNYSLLMGNFVTAGVANIYRAPSDRTVTLTFRDGLIDTAGDAVADLLREFLSRPLTTNVPSFAKGKR